MTQTTTTQPCRYVADDQPRAIKGRHTDDCPNPDQCKGCQPCGAHHCRVCNRRHATVTCPECVGTMRDDLDEILRLCVHLRFEAITRGLNSEAAVLYGPTANPEAWWNRVDSALAGRTTRLPEGVELDEDGDIVWLDKHATHHPLWVLGTWEWIWREYLEHATDKSVSIPAAIDYLKTQLGYMADQKEPDIALFADAIHNCRTHLESVLHEGEQIEKGAPCPVCRENEDPEPPALVLIRDDDYENDPNKTGKGDRWTCKRCKSWWTPTDYRNRVLNDHLKYADRLTMRDLPGRCRIPAGTIKRWAGRQRRGFDSDGHPIFDPPLLRPCGRSDDGRHLYRVDDVEALRDGRIGA